MIYILKYVCSSGSVGVVHMATWLQTLTPSEQEKVTMDLLDYLRRNPRNFTIQGNPTGLSGNEVFIHFEGAEPGSIDTSKCIGLSTIAVIAKVHVSLTIACQSYKC